MQDCTSSGTSSAHQNHHKHHKQDKQETHFGYRQVAVEEKKKLVGQVFSSVAENYDVMNDLMSLGIHRYWKRRAVEMLDVHQNVPLRILDLAGGTGDLSILLAHRSHADSQVVLADINYEMVSVGRSQRIDQGYSAMMDYTIANAEQLPYPDNSFDRLIIGFGLRNVTDKQKALDEMYRVLAPNGQDVGVGVF